MSKKDAPDGFEEFAHSINELSPQEKQKRKQSQDKTQSFELYSFLEEEVKRLDLLSQALEETAHLLGKYPQEQSILHLKASENGAEIDNLLELLSDPKNNFWRSLSETFNDSF